MYTQICIECSRKSQLAVRPFLTKGSLKTPKSYSNVRGLCKAETSNNDTSLEQVSCTYNRRFTIKEVYLINAGGISLFKIWSSVVCTVSFPTCRRKKSCLRFRISLQSPDENKQQNSNKYLS